MGPVEVLVISFPGNQFTGDIIPELRRLTDNGVISVSTGCSFARTVTAK